MIRYLFQPPPPASKINFQEHEIHPWVGSRLSRPVLEPSALPQLGSGGAASLFITTQPLLNGTVSFDFTGIKAVHLIQSFLIQSRKAGGVPFCSPNSP